MALNWHISQSPLFSVSLSNIHVEVYAETILFTLIVLYSTTRVYSWLFASKAKDVYEPIDETLISERLAAYQRKPLAPPLTKPAELTLQHMPLVQGRPNRYITLKPKDSKVASKLLNFGTSDYLAYGSDPQVFDAANASLTKYGCGACGPRGFYGTFDVHLELEAELKRFFGVDDCIVYSDSFVTAPSVLAAFASRGDVIVCDEACNDSILNGCHLARSEIVTFKHNDMKDLEEKLSAITPKARGRRLLVVEGLYKNTGDIVPLKQVMELKEKYKWRLFLDESFSVGVLGKFGRGAAEHFDVQWSDIDFIIGSLDNIFAGIGGFCVGSSIVVGHQRLMGAGYCFSAALPPFLCSSSIAALHQFEKNGEQDMKKLKENTELLHKLISSRTSLLAKYFVTESSPLSPACHLRLQSKLTAEKTTEDCRDIDKRYEEESKLRLIAKQLSEEFNIFVVVPTFACLEGVKNQNKTDYDLPFSTIKIQVTLFHTKEDIKNLVEGLGKVAEGVIG